MVKMRFKNFLNEVSEHDGRVRDVELRNVVPDGLVFVKFEVQCRIVPFRHFHQVFRDLLDYLILLDVL